MSKKIKIFLIVFALLAFTSIIVWQIALNSEKLFPEISMVEDSTENELAANPVKDELVNTQVAEEPATIPLNNFVDSCVPEGEFDPSIDYFPEKTNLLYTNGFTVEYFNNYKVVTVTSPWPGATESNQYILVQCGTPVPERYSGYQVITVPVQRIVTMSTSYLPFLDALGLLDRLVGVDDGTYISNENVNAMIAENKLEFIGYGAGVDVERTLELAPDVVMTYSAGFLDYDAHPILLDAGINVVLNGEWMDPSPLGRAEWGKFLAAFFNKEAMAETFFNQTVENYNNLKEIANRSREKPTVLLNSDYQGSWYLPGGEGYMAAFISDAGGDYLWSDILSAQSTVQSFEEVFERAQNADIWLNPGIFSSLNALLAADSRYAEFSAFQNGSVWNNDARISANGGNDFYESAVAHPETVLADLIKIFHPELLPDYVLVYYRVLE